MYPENERERFVKERNERRVAGQFSYAGLRDTTWKCLPFPLPSVLCRVAFCSKA